MLLWKEGKKNRGKNRHSVIRENLRVSNIPGNIKEPPLVSVPEHQGLQGGGCCERDTKEDSVLLFPLKPVQSLGLPPRCPLVPFDLAAGTKDSALGPLLQSLLVSP